MKDKRQQLVFAFPGDVFLVSGDKKTTVEIYQSTNGLPNPHIRHAACMVSPYEVMEANFPEKTYTMHLKFWSQKHGDDTVTILRHPNASWATSDAIRNAAVEFFNESYPVWDAIRNRPPKEDHSICSGLVAKLLMEAGLIGADVISENSQTYPGELCSILINKGWVTIPYTTEYYHNPLFEDMPLLTSNLHQGKKSLHESEERRRRIDAFIKKQLNGQ